MVGDGTLMVDVNGDGDGADGHLPMVSLQLGGAEQRALGGATPPHQHPAGRPSLQNGAKQSAILSCCLALELSPSDTQ